MKNTANVKERIIAITTGLIEEKKDTKSITARMIAEKAGIGLGLINYHFDSKDNLIDVCVQRIIGKVVAEYQMEKDYETDKERLIACATSVFNFLFEHSAISRISILGDLNSYGLNCNSVNTQKGFMLKLKQDIADEDKPIFSFILTAAMQIAFLGSETVKTILGYDLSMQEGRAAYVEKLVSLLFESNQKDWRQL